ncbi:MAG TPA: TetR/AcrR family transcriptional regulator [Mycobacterium sp.]
MHDVAYDEGSRTAKSELTRARIVRAAREVFAELGYAATTYQAIATRAKLTRPAINHYFPAKSALYHAALRQAREVFIIPVAKRALREEGLVARLSALIASAVQAKNEDPAFAAFQITAVMDGQRHPELNEFQPEFLRGFLGQAIDDAVEQGELAGDCDRVALTETLVAVLWGLNVYAGYFGNARQVEQVATNLQQLLAGNLWQN